MTFTMPDANEVNEVGAEYTNEPGIYHVVCVFAESPPTDRDGNIVQNSLARFRFKILNGTNPTQTGKEIGIYVNRPDLSHNDQGKFASAVAARFARALEILPQVAPGQQVNVDWNAALGKQVVLDMQPKKDSDKPRLELNGKRVYHMADQEIASVPKGNPSDVPTQQQQQAVQQPVQQQQVQQTAQQPPQQQHAVQQPPQQQQLQQPPAPPASNTGEWGGL